MTNGALTLGTTVNNGTQMSEQWIDRVIDLMENSTNEEAAALYQTILNVPSISKIVTAVDKNTGEIVITKLNGF